MPEAMSSDQTKDITQSAKKYECITVVSPTNREARLRAEQALGKLRTKSRGPGQHTNMFVGNLSAVFRDF